MNSKTRQSSNTSDMIFDVPTLIEFLSGSTTLYPGTVILTGTPEGVGMAMDPPHFLAPGDFVEIEIEKIGVLSNPVVSGRIVGKEFRSCRMELTGLILVPGIFRSRSWPDYLQVSSS